MSCIVLSNVLSFESTFCLLMSLYILNNNKNKKNFKTKKEMASDDIDIANSGGNRWIFQYRYMIPSLSTIVRAAIAFDFSGQPYVPYW